MCAYFGRLPLSINWLILAYREDVLNLHYMELFWPKLYKGSQLYLIWEEKDVLILPLTSVTFKEEKKKHWSPVHFIYKEIVKKTKQTILGLCDRSFDLQRSSLSNISGFKYKLAFQEYNVCTTVL